MDAGKEPDNRPGPPTGHIAFEGGSMAFWLPDGVTPEAIRVAPVKSEKAKKT